MLFFFFMNQWLNSLNRKVLLIWCSLIGWLCSCMNLSAVLTVMSPSSSYCMCNCVIVSVYICVSVPGEAHHELLLGCEQHCSGAARPESAVSGAVPHRLRPVHSALLRSGSLELWPSHQNTVQPTLPPARPKQRLSHQLQRVCHRTQWVDVYTTACRLIESEFDSCESCYCFR